MQLNLKVCLPLGVLEPRRAVRVLLLQKEKVTLPPALSIRNRIECK